MSPNRILCLHMSPNCTLCLHVSLNCNLCHHVSPMSFLHGVSLCLIAVRCAPNTLLNPFTPITPYPNHPVYPISTNSTLPQLLHATPITSIIYLYLHLPTFTYIYLLLPTSTPFIPNHTYQMYLLVLNKLYFYSTLLLL